MIYAERGKSSEIGRGKTMLILKHVEYEIGDSGEMEGLVAHLRQTTSQVEGVTFKDIYFVKGKKEFVLFLECDSEERYLEWREICPPPEGAADWYEILLAKDAHFPTKNRGD
jgi:hypothetical protein